MTVHSSTLRFTFLAALLASASGSCQLEQRVSQDSPTPPLRERRDGLDLTEGTHHETQIPAGERAAFFGPTGVALVDHVAGLSTDRISVRYLLVSDTLNHTIRRVELSTGRTTTFLGTPAVPGSSGLLLRRPTALAVSWPGNGEYETFVADTGNHTIRRVYYVTGSDPVTGLESTTLHVDVVAGVAGQSGYQSAGAPRLDAPQGVAIGEMDTSGFAPRVATVYVADTGNAVIRRVTLSTGAVELIAGVPGEHGFGDAAVGIQAKFNRPTGIAVHAGKLYVADTGNHVIRVIDLTPSGTYPVSLLAGTAGVYGHQDGPRQQAAFAQPVGVSFDMWGHRLLVADRASYTVRSVDVSPGAVAPAVTTLAGVPWERSFFDDSSAGRFRAPSGVVPFANTVYVTDTGNNLIRRVRLEGGVGHVSTLTGQRKPGSRDGWPQGLEIGAPTTVVCDGNRLFINGAGVQQIELDPGANAGQVRSVASTTWSHFLYRENALYRALEYSVHRLDLQSGAYAQYFAVPDLVDGSVLGLVATQDSLYTRWDDGGRGTRRFHLAAGVQDPTSDEDLPDIYVEDVPVSDGTYLYSRTATGLLKTDPNATPVARTEFPVDLGGETMHTLAVSGDYVYFTTDGPATGANRHRVRRVQLSTGMVTNVAGAGLDTPFESPSGLCLSGTNLFVADTGNGRIQRIDLTSGMAFPIALRRAQ